MCRALLFTSAPRTALKTIQCEHVFPFTARVSLTCCVLAEIGNAKYWESRWAGPELPSKQEAGKVSTHFILYQEHCTFNSCIKGDSCSWMWKREFLGLDLANTHALKLLVMHITLIQSPVQPMERFPVIQSQIPCAQSEWYRWEQEFAMQVLLCQSALYESLCLTLYCASCQDRGLQKFHFKSLFFTTTSSLGKLIPAPLLLQEFLNPSHISNFLLFADTFWYYPGLEATLRSIHKAALS